MSQTHTIQIDVLVKDIMTTHVHTVAMDDSMQKVKDLFDRERCHHAIVLAANRVFGVVSDRDILKVVSPFVGNVAMERAQDVNTMKKRVHQIMSRDLVTIGPEKTVVAAAEMMLSEGVSSLPVVDEYQSLLGIVTKKDIVKWAVRTARQREELVGEVEPDGGIVVIVDGTRCYHPPVTIGRLIRSAARSHAVEHGANSACLSHLPHPRAEAAAV